MNDLNIILLGLGAVGRTLLLLLKKKGFKGVKLTIVDKENCEELIKRLELTNFNSVEFTQCKLDSNNYYDTLKKCIEVIPNGITLMIDATYSVDTLSLLKFCRQYNILFVNSSVENWDERSETDSITLSERQEKIRLEMKLELNSNSNSTMLLDMGVNPGLISAWTKHGVKEFYRSVHNGSVHTDDVSLREMVDKLKLTAAIISEYDSQISSIGNKRDSMVNTWSPDGYLEEIFAPVEYTERNSSGVCVADTCGFYNMVYSAVPSRTFAGYAIRHSESITLGKLLQGNSPVSPVTVFYAYRSCDNSIASLNDLQISKHYSSKRVMTDDIVSGTDEIGILLVSSEYGSYWCGSEKSIKEAREYFDNKYNDLINITTLQTAAGYYAGIMWILLFPNKGVIYPEDIESSFVLNMTHDTVAPFTCKKVEYNIRDKPKRTVGTGSITDSTPVEFTFNDFKI